MSALTFLWNHRTASLGVIQIIFSQIATSGLVGDHTTKWLMLGTGIATGLVGLMNTIAQRRATSETA
jgi:F0F1-type ATP synthase membrane subunit c/vacuolar-type H+-ATPase subunit K